MAPFRDTGIVRRVRRRLVNFLAGPELDGHIRTVARESRLRDYVVFGDAERLTIGLETQVNDALFNVTSGTIVVRETAFFGHGVRVLTGTHDVTCLGVDRQLAVPTEGRDIVIDVGAWVSSYAMVLGPCTIGAHAVVASGAVVTGDVEPYTIVAGVPARPVGRVQPRT